MSFLEVVKDVGSCCSQLHASICNIADIGVSTLLSSKSADQANTSLVYKMTPPWCIRGTTILEKEIIKINITKRKLKYFRVEI